MKTAESSASLPVRIVVSAFGATGHVFPALALARELRGRGHEVLVESLERWREVVEDLDLEFAPAPEYVAFPFPWPGKPAEPTLAQVVRDFAGLLEEFRADVVVNDFFTLPPILAAETLGIRRATLVPHVYPVGAPGLPRFLIGLHAPRTRAGAAAWRLAGPLLEGRPKRERAELNEVRAELDLPPLDRYYGGVSDQLALVATFPQLEYPREWPAHVHVTGPMFFELPHPPVEGPPGDRPLVLIAGSTAQDQELEFIRIGLETLADEPVRVLAAMNQRGREWSGDVPANAKVVDWLSYAETMPRVAAVLCNGGHGTVVRSLADGAPVLVSPADGDMAENGARASWSGAGLMLPRRMLRPDPLRWAVRRLMGDERIASRASEIAAWSARNDGAARGADLVEELASR